MSGLGWNRFTLTESLSVRVRSRYIVNFVPYISHHSWSPSITLGLATATTCPPNDCASRIDRVPAWLNIMCAACILAAMWGLLYKCEESNDSPDAERDGGIRNRARTVLHHLDTKGKGRKLRLNDRFEASALSVSKRVAPTVTTIEWRQACLSPGRLMECC